MLCDGVCCYVLRPQESAEGEREAARAISLLCATRRLETGRTSSRSRTDAVPTGSVLGDLDGGDDDRLERLVARVCRRTFDGFDDLLALDDFAEDCTANEHGTSCESEQ